MGYSIIKTAPLLLKVRSSPALSKMIRRPEQKPSPPDGGFVLRASANAANG